MALILEIAAHGLTAILATWLGLLVYTRARRSTGAGAFAFLALLLATWSVAIIGQRLGTRPEMHGFLNVLEDFGAFLLPAATAHLAIAIALEGRSNRWATAILVAGYAVGLVAWVQTALDPTHPILPSPPHWEPLGIPGEIIGWAFILARAGIFAAGIGWLIAALRNARSDVARQRQLHATLVTLGLGIAGGMARILPEGVAGPPWVGVSMVAAAAAIAVYGVFAQRLFTDAELTGRAVRLSLGIGLGVAAYVAALIVLDRAVAAAIGLDLPVVIGLALVATIALFDPVADFVRALALGRRDEDRTLGRLLRALGEDVVTTRKHDDMVAPAMERLVRTFDLSGAALVDRDGTTVVTTGDVPIDATATRISLDAAGATATFGPKRSGLPLTPAEVDLLRLATGYVDAAIRLGAQQGAQASVLAELSREGEAVDRREAALAEALAAHAATERGLRVYALGPLRAELDGAPLRQWGGAKAGSRQAEAVFAFLFDRGERGAAKEEIVELVWPDIDLERADMAFHRTLLGLRGALAPARAGRSKDGPIVFGNDRYRLAPDVVAWSDLAEFESLVDRARGIADPRERLHLLEAARALYRGDLLDDCPFYGDSAEVEEHREELRERYVDLLVDLGLGYVERGDRSGATSALRRAAALSGRERPVIAEALAGLDVGAAGPSPQPVVG
ncbi:MAG TPA: histidine kinase N-terminal 7TM domain-containing protein [Candidatus Limnocylindria bacterium]|nr:histidine kinase N-terminal 7TM domain-containing protein [Candidatus Limnocylindria bacterium]